MVEIMVAMVILAVVAIGTAAYLSQHQAWLMLDRDRSAALEIANGRVEELRAIPYKTLAQWLPLTNYSTRYLIKVGSSWSNAVSPQTESTNVNGAAATMLTAIQSAGVTSSTFNYVVISVQMDYSKRAETQVKLVTYYSK